MDISEAHKVLVEFYDRYECGKAFDCCDIPRFASVEYDELLKVASIRAGSNVLDLGTGTGGLALKASESIGPSVSIVGVDMLEGWLKVAEEKAKKNGVSNAEFRVMNMESLEFPDNTFDYVVSNFALCCTFRYDKGLKEANRVLKPGGKLAYNHDGPHDTEQSQLFDRIFSKYKTRQPSEILKKIREANELQDNLFVRYRDPFAALAAIRSSGFKNVEAKIGYPVYDFSTIDNYLAWKFPLGLDDPELQEIPQIEREKMMRELTTAMQSLMAGDGFKVAVETVYYTGYK